MAISSAREPPAAGRWPWSSATSASERTASRPTGLERVNGYERKGTSRPGDSPPSLVGQRTSGGGTDFVSSSKRGRPGCCQAPLGGGWAPKPPGGGGVGGPPGGGGPDIPAAWTPGSCAPGRTA